MWRFLTTATMFVILLAGSHASPAVAAKAASPHHYQTFRGKVVAPPYRYFRCKGGRFYAYGGGWGCDYYRYSYKGTLVVTKLMGLHEASRISLLSVSGWRRRASLSESLTKQSTHPIAPVG
jgi:hypothetical protein